MAESAMIWRLDSCRLISKVTLVSSGNRQLIFGLRSIRLLVSSRPVCPFLPPLLRRLADARVLPHVQAELVSNHRYQVVLVRTRRPMIIVFRDTRRQVNDDLVFFDLLFFLDEFDHIRDLSMHGSAAAPAAAPPRSPQCRHPPPAG